MSAPTGYTAIGIVGFADQGGFEENKRYYRNQVVHYYGFPYVCIRDSVKGVSPTDVQCWRPMVAPEEEED